MIMPVTQAAVLAELRNIGAHPASLKGFLDRSAIRPVKIFGVRMPAANIIKQEMLSCGADCAINENCVTGRTEYSDALLLGTVKQYRELLRKLEPMRFFGLQNIAREINEYLDLTSPVTVLADGRTLDYSQVCVMGILNWTQDSFYAGSRRSSLDEALQVAGQMLDGGAGILDIGAESTRPGSTPVSEDEEKRKITVAVEAIKKAYPQAIISVDTYRPAVMRTAIEFGADIINDITGAADCQMGELAAEKNVPIIIMHMQGTPKNMQENPVYDDVVKELLEFFTERSSRLMQQGVGREKIIIDPGIGFGKKLEHNLELTRRIKEFSALGFPYLLAASRKACIGQALGGIPAEERLEGTIALSCQAVVEGAHLIRVHDVKENVRAVRMLEAVRNG